MTDIVSVLRRAGEDLSKASTFLSKKTRDRVPETIQMIAEVLSAPTPYYPLPTEKLDSVWKKHSVREEMDRVDFQDAARDIERACAEAWGVKLSEGDNNVQA